LKVRNRKKFRGGSEKKKLDLKERENSNGEMGERNRGSTYKQMVVK